MVCCLLLKEHFCWSSLGIWKNTGHLGVFLVAMWQCLSPLSQGALSAGIRVLEGAVGALNNLVRSGNGFKKGNVRSTRVSKVKEQTTK